MKDEQRSADAASISSMFVFTAEKAGMKGVDKQHVREIVHKMSKDSLYYQKSLRDNAKVEYRVARMRKQLACLSNGQLHRLEHEADARVVKLESLRDLTRIICVVDMDMFYAAVEMRDDPKLRDVPLAVGGLGMISTANYAARKYGIRAAMPGFIGKELCPKLHFVPVNMEKYKAVAAHIRALFEEYDPDFESFSLDEACLDLTDYVANNWQKYVLIAPDTSKVQEPEERWISTATGRAAIAGAVIKELRQKIFDCTQLTASAGIAVNAMLAKICSDMNKPNGQFLLPFTRDSVINFIRKLSVRKIGGVGKVMEKTLNEALDIHTGADLFAQRGKLCYLFSDKTASWLLQISLGIQVRREKLERKSFSRERTFGALNDPIKLEAKCLDICMLLAEDLEKANKAAKHVTFVYKGTDFARYSRSMSLATAIYTADDLYSIAVELLRRELPLSLRLMGVRAATLVSRFQSTTSPTTFSLAPASKKRQIVIKKFAEHVSDSATALPDKLAELNDRENIRCSDKHAPDSDPLLQLERNLMKPSSVLHSADTNVDGIYRPLAPCFKSMKARKVVIRPCPICGRPLNTLNNIKVNQHIDACVGTKMPSTSLTDGCGSKGIAVSQFFEYSTKRIKKTTTPCPICGKLLNTRNNLEVNAHVDVCVNRPLVNRKRGSNDGSTLDTYF